MIRTINPEMLLRVFEVSPKNGSRPGRSGIFVLGTGSRHRITVVSQQNRAISLVNALMITGRLRVDDTIGVIGAGAAGATAAACAATHGFKTTLLEAESKPLHVFSRATHRWLHPGIFNWPTPGWENPATNFPCMNWSFARASDVAATLIEELKSLERAGKHLKIETDLEALRLCEQHREHINVVSKNGRLFEFNHLIVAVGFGREAVFQDSPGYWEPDNFAAPKHPIQKYCVVGAGDGGLIDCVRLRLRDFDEGVLVHELLPLWPEEERRKVEQNVFAFEGESGERLSPSTSGAYYSSLDAPWLEDLLHTRLREDTSVILTDEKDFPFLPSAAPLNKFLFSRLQRIDAHSVRYISARFICNEDKNTWSLSNDSGESIQGGDATKLILRTGYSDAMKAFSHQIAEWASRTAAELSRLDFFRYYFDPSHSVPLSKALPDREAAILSSEELFSELARRNAETFYIRLSTELRNSDLSSIAHHEALFKALQRDRSIRRSLGSRELILPAMFSDQMRRQGVMTSDMEQILKDNILTVAISPVCVAAAACFFYLREKLGLRLRLRFDAAQSVNFIARIRDGSETHPPDLIVGQDALAYEAICAKTNPSYFPISGSLNVEHCVLGTLGADISLPALSGLLFVPNESPNALARRFKLVLKPSLPSWTTSTKDISEQLITASQASNEHDVHLYSYGIIGDVAEWLGIGASRPLSSLLEGPSAGVAQSSIGAIVAREDLDRNRLLRDAVIVSFLQAYRELSWNADARRSIAQKMLAERNYIGMLGAAIGYAAFLKETGH